MLIETIRTDMNKALKAGFVTEKLTLSMLLGALQLKEKEKRAPLTEAEEIEVLMKEIKQTKETIDTAPVDRWDVIEPAQSRLKVLERYAPAQMTRKEIVDVIIEIMINNSFDYSMKSKGAVMKLVTPFTKGRADGKLVNSIVDEILT